MNENLSRIVTDLFAKAKRGEEVSSDIQRLQAEIKNAIEDEDTMFGKVRSLEASFREIIPDERQRYNAAIKAVSTTFKLSRQEIVKAVHTQLDELKIIEKVLMPALPGWRDDVTAMEAKLQEMRAEVLKFRERIVVLENQEKEILTSMASREKDMEVVEKSMREVFTNVGAEINFIINKIDAAAEADAARQVPQQAVPPQPAAQQPVPQAVVPLHMPQQSVAPNPIPQQQVTPQPVAQQPITQQVTPQPVAQQPITQQVIPQEPVLQEPITQQGIEQQAIAQQPIIQKDPSEIQIGQTESGDKESAPEQIDTDWQKKCPMCGGRMNLHSNEGIWLCYSCAFEEKTDQVQARSEKTQAAKPSEPAEGGLEETFDAPPRDADPWVSTRSMGRRESKKELSDEIEQPTKKKNCPACNKKMQWFAGDKAWRCSYCQYERRI